MSGSETSRKVLSPAGAVALWAGLTLLLVFQGVWRGYGGRPFLWAAVVIAVLLAGQILPAARALVPAAQSVGGDLLVFLLPGWLAGVYAVYALGAAHLSVQRFLAGLAYFEWPVLLCGLARRRPAACWLDYLAVVSLWVPIELRWAHRLWPYPPAGTHLLSILAGVNTAVASFLFLRRLEGIGYCLDWARGYGRAVALHFGLFALIAIPLGEMIHFIRFSPSWSRLQALPVTALGILFFTAWPEELLFRGLLQNLLSRTCRRSWAGWVVASVIFGFSHINNGPFPNWRYVFLASIAGLFYGRAWSRTGSLTPACLVHALVDVTWHTFFGG